MREHYSRKHNFYDTINWLRLIRSARVGPRTFYQLLSRFGSAATALDALPALAQRGRNGQGGKRQHIKVCTAIDAEKEIEAHHKLGATLITRDDTRYPPRLRHVDDAPPVLSVLGRIELLQKRTVAVIGARNASLNGQRFGEQLSRDLGANGLMVASGLARGIDAAAHRGALPTGTLAALGCGVDVIYPRENTGLYEAIKQHGVVVSELAPGTRPKAQHFPRRNRIISGVSRGVVVVEAAPRSGSLITARLALEQGRDVFAVPGAAMDPRARGTNDLIRQGAILTDSADDILNVIAADRPTSAGDIGPTNADGTGYHASTSPITTAPPIITASSVINDAQDTETARRSIERWIGPTPTHMDAIMRHSDLPPAALNDALIELELAGRLARHPGNMISIISLT